MPCAFPQNVLISALFLLILSPPFFFPLCMGIFFFFFLLQQLLCLRLIEDFLTANVVGIESHEYGRTTKKIGDGGAGAGLWMTEGLQKM